MSSRKKAHSPPKLDSRKRSLRIHGTVARDLGSAILSGRYRPGDGLRGEIEASQKLKISRTAYREAIRILAAKGLVASMPKTGTHITESAEWHLLDPDVLEWMFDFEPELQLIESLFELRSILEPEAAALAASRRTSAQLVRMRTALLGMAKHTLRQPAGRAADRDFHLALLDATHNPFLVSLARGISSAVAWTTEYKERVGPGRFNPDPIPAHQQVLDAIASKDAERARKSMRELVDASCFDAIKARQSARRTALDTNLARLRTQ